MIFNQQANRDRRHRAQDAQRLVDQPTAPVPMKAVVGRFAIPNQAMFHRPADEYKKGPAGDTKKHVQISEASYTESVLYGPNAPTVSKAYVQKADQNYKIPRGFGDEDLHTRALNNRGSE